MKKHSHIIALLVVFSLVLTMAPMNAQAAAKTLVGRKSDAATKSLTSYANYRGWEVNTRVTKRTGKQVAKSLRIETASGTYFAFKQVTKKSGKKYATYFTAKGSKLTLKDVKRSISHYSNDKTVKSFLKARSKKAANSLATYGKKRGWTAKIATSTTSSRSISKITFRNGGCEFVAQVKVARNRKSPKKSYTLKGKASSAKGIKEWLEKYKETANPENPASEENPTDSTNPPTTTPSTNPTTKPSTGPNAEELKSLATIYANDLIAVGKEYGWEVTVTSSTEKVDLAFDNLEWGFNASVRVETTGDGKAFIAYRLQGIESSRDEIVQWLSEYAVAPTNPPEGTNAPNATEPPSGTEAPGSSPAPSSPTPDTITEAELKAAATVHMNELLTEAVENGWGHTETLNTGTKIQNSFENSEYEFKVTVEAKEKNGAIQVAYTLTTDIDYVVDKDLVIEWLTKYKADPKPTETPSPSPTPTLTPTPSPTPTLMPTETPTVPTGPTAIGGGENADGSGAGAAQPKPKRR